jgi:hypothetical protein
MSLDGLVVTHTALVVLVDPKLVGIILVLQVLKAVVAVVVHHTLTLVIT